MDSVESATRFWYSTLGPSILLIPLWYLYGRLILRGEEDDWDASNSGLEHGLPGIVVFQIVLWWREHHYRREYPLPEIGLGMWGIYALHFLVQVFYVTTTSKDDNNGHKESWSLATRYFGMSTLMSERFGFGLLIDLWIIMMVVLFVSYWTWEMDSNHGRRPPRSTVQLICIKMTDSLKPAQFIVPIWYFLGHLTLWGVGVNLQDFLLSTLLLTPFHVWLYYNHNNNQDNNQLLSFEVAYTLVVYYTTLCLSQFLVPNGVLEFYFRVPSIAIWMATWVCRVFIGLAVITTIALQYWQSNNNTTNNNTTLPSPPTSSIPAEALAEPLLPTGADDTAADLESNHGGNETTHESAQQQHEGAQPPQAAVEINQVED